MINAKSYKSTRQLRNKMLDRMQYKTIRKGTSKKKYLWSETAGVVGKGASAFLLSK